MHLRISPANHGPDANPRHQFQDGPCARAHCAVQPARTRRRGDRVGDTPESADATATAGTHSTLARVCKWHKVDPLLGDAFRGRHLESRGGSWQVIFDQPQADDFISVRPPPKRVWGRSPGIPDSRLSIGRRRSTRSFPNRIDIETAKILHQLPAVEHTSSRISNKRVENQRLGTDCQTVDQEVGGSNPPSCTSKINHFSGRPKSKIAFGVTLEVTATRFCGPLIGTACVCAGISM